MYRTEIKEVLQGRDGQPIVAASVTVLDSNGNEAVIYESETGSSTLSNPIVSDADGVLDGWLEEGSYTLNITSARGSTYSQRIESASGRGKSGVFSVRDFGAKGDTVTDDTEAFQDAVDACLAAGGGTVLIPRSDGHYLITDTINVIPDAHIYAPFRITGDGVIRVATTAAPGIYFYNNDAANIQVRNFQLDSFYMYGVSGCGDLIKIEGANSFVDGATHAFILRDLSLEAAFAHGVHIKGYVFEFALDNVKAFCDATNVTGSCIHLDGVSSGKMSSVSLINCNTRKGLYGVKVANATFDINVFGGTFIDAQNEGLYLKNDGGVVNGAHVEDNWKSAGAPAAGQAGLYFEGRGSIIGLKGSIDGNQLHGARIYADNGQVNVVGRSQAGASGEWLYVGGSASGTINLIGVGANEVSGTYASLLHMEQAPDRALRFGKAETMSRYNIGASAALTSGTLHLTAIYLPAGLEISTISYFSGSTALAAGTNQWFSLWDSSRNLLAVTADDTSTAWGTNTIKTLTLSATYTTTRDGLYYVGILVVAGTPPNIQGHTMVSSAPLVQQPRLNGTSNTALTNPASAPATANAISSSAGVPYVSVN